MKSVKGQQLSLIHILIAFATPSMYTSVVNSDLQQQTDALVERLKETKFEDCGSVLDDFIRSSRADVMLLNADGEIADTGSEPVSYTHLIWYAFGRSG